MIYTLDDRRVETADDSYWVAPSASVIGDVYLGKNTSVWFSAVVRGDVEPIRIGDGSNVQECSVLHTDPGAPLTIGENVTIGHSANVHGCEIGDGTLVGIGASILNHAKVGKNCMIGANTLIAEGKVIPDNSLVVGSPGKVIREVTPEMLEGMKANNAFYQGNGVRFKNQLKIDERS